VSVPRQFRYAFVDLDREAAQVFDPASLPAQGPPEALIIAGPVASGKTTYRRRYKTIDHVVLDAGEIFLSLCCNRYFDFPSSVFAEEVEHLGTRIAHRAIAERRHLVCEFNALSCNEAALTQLLAALRQRGYAMKFEWIQVDVKEGWRRNVQRAQDSISSIHTDAYHWRWLHQALANGQGGS
jgi:hypothetical protein